MSLHQPLWMAAGAQQIIVDAVGFDGADVMRRGAGFTGAANSKTGILSLWIYLQASAGFPVIAQLGSSAVGSAALRGVQLSWNAGTNGHLSLQGASATPVVCLNIQTNTGLTAGSWYHYLASWDMSTLTVHQYLNDVSDRWGSFETLIDDSLNYANGENSVGGDGAGPSYLGGMAELYFAPGQYLDFSIVANRRKFISAGGKPVSLGTDGSAPTGTAPIAYFHLDDGEAPANFALNRSTGGNMSITGALTTYGSSPSG